MAFMYSKKRAWFFMLLTTTFVVTYFLSLNYRTSVCQFKSLMSKRTIPVNRTNVPINSTTIITAFFRFGQSKHSSNEYESWINNFLPYITTPMVIFTDKESALFIKSVRGRQPLYLILYDTVWDIPSPTASLRHRYQTDQHELDSEKKIHSPELYAIWNSKSWMVAHTSQLNPFNSTYFYWVDIGAFRSERMRRTRWPDLNLVTEIFESGTVNRLHVFLIEKVSLGETEPRYDELSKINLIVGGFFGGTSEAVRWFSKIFYETHNAMMDKGFFVGKDQTLMNYILFRHRSKFFVTYFQKYDGMIRIDDCDDEWFHFINWYSEETERTPCCPVSPIYKMDDFSQPLLTRPES